MHEVFAWLPEQGFLRLVCDAVWQTTLLGALTWGCLRLFCRHPATRSWIIVLGISLCLVAPFLSYLARIHGCGLVAPALGAATDPGPGRSSELRIPDGAPHEEVVQHAASRSPGPQEPAPAALRQPFAVGSTASLALAGETALARQGLGYLAVGMAALWPVAIVFLGLRFCASLLRVVQILRCAQECRDQTLLKACCQASRMLGLRRIPRVCSSDLVTCPTTTAWRPACVIVPAAARQGTDWFAVFCHELAHVRRGDGWTRILVELSTILLPWQSLMWLLRQEHIRACEEACDDWVLFAGADPTNTPPR